jgi:archaellum component FlaC
MVDVEKKIREIENELVGLKIKINELANEWVYFDEKIDELEETCVFSNVERLMSEIEEIKKEITAIRVALKQLISDTNGIQD